MPDPLTTVQAVTTVPLDPATVSPPRDPLDVPFGELFTDDQDGAYNPPTESVSPASPASVTVPPAVPAPPSRDYFIRTETGTVYKSEQDAIQGIEHKDTLIKQLRERYIQERGIDPITNQPVAPQPTAPVLYTQNPKQYYQDLVAAVNKNDAEAYFAAQDRLIQERVQSVLGNILPALTDTVNVRASQVVAKEIPDFSAVKESPAFREAVESLPLLKEAITLAESQPEYSQRLPELYRMAYAWTQFKRGPVAVMTTVAPPTPQLVRPTLSSTTPLPPSRPSTPPELNSVDGRKSLIEIFERSAEAGKLWGS